MALWDIISFCQQQLIIIEDCEKGRRGFWEFPDFVQKSFSFTYIGMSVDDQYVYPCFSCPHKNGAFHSLIEKCLRASVQTFSLAPMDTKCPQFFGYDYYYCFTPNTLFSLTECNFYAVFTRCETNLTPFYVVAFHKCIFCLCICVVTSFPVDIKPHVVDS